MTTSGAFFVRLRTATRVPWTPQPVPDAYDPAVAYGPPATFNNRLFYPEKHLSPASRNRVWARAGLHNPELWRGFAQGTERFIASPPEIRDLKTVSSDITIGDPMKPVAIGYLRVSTAGQYESGLSIEAQRSRIEAMATISEYSLARIIEDKAASGKSLHRPGMIELLELVDSGAMDALVCAKLDRVSRSVVDLANLLDQLRTAPRKDGGTGVNLVSAAEQLDTGSPAGRLCLTVLSAIAQWERESISERTISERTVQALAVLKSRGMATGTPPFGYMKLEDGRLVEKADEQRVLEKINELVGTRKPWRSITDEINGAGYRTRRGTMFSRQGIQAICRTAGISRPSW